MAAIASCRPPAAAAPLPTLARGLARPRRSLARPAASSSSMQAEVSRLVEQEGCNLYSMGAAGEQLAAAVAALKASNSCQRPGPESVGAGAHGTWEVFYAPHIARLSALLGARFHIRYTLRGQGELISNVRYQHPLLGTGWLSASGTIEAADDTTLLLHFDRFWWDVGEAALRPELADGGSGSSSGGSGSGGSSGSSSGSGGGGSDGWVNAVGRAAFIPGIARFPVEYLDVRSGLAVFRFPPLASSIAIARRGDSGGGGGGER